MAADLWAGGSLMLNRIVSSERGLDITRLAVRLTRNRRNFCIVDGSSSQLLVVLAKLILSAGRWPYLCWNSVEQTDICWIEDKTILQLIGAAL